MRLKIPASGSEQAILNPGALKQFLVLDPRVRPISERRTTSCGNPVRCRAVAAKMIWSRSNPIYTIAERRWMSSAPSRAIR